MNKFIKYFYAILIFVFLYFPIITVVVFSFNNSRHSLIWQGFTLNWYKILFSNHSLLHVTFNSILLGTTVATVSTFIGTIISVSLFRYKFFGRKIIHVLIFIFLLIPEIIIATTLLVFFNFFEIPLGFWTLFVSHVVLCIPIVSFTIYSRIITLNKEIFEAAMDLGATDFVIFYKIIIPILYQAIISGWLLSLTLSLDDIIISYFVSGPSFEILPLKIYAMVRLGIKPEVNALCSLMLMLTLFTVIINYKSIFKKK